MVSKDAEQCGWAYAPIVPSPARAVPGLKFLMGDAQPRVQSVHGDALPCTIGIRRPIPASNACHSCEDRPDDRAMHALTSYYPASGGTLKHPVMTCVITASMLGNVVQHLQP